MIARKHRPNTKLPSPPTQQTEQQRIEHGGLIWLDVVRPGDDEVTFLSERYHFHPLHLKDVLSRLQRPQIDDDQEREYVFLVLHFPVFDANRRISVVSEIDIFAGRDYIITLHDGRLKPLTRLVSSSTSSEQVRAKIMSRGSGYLLYRIINTLINECFRMLYRVDANVDRIEDGIFNRNVQETVQELSFVRHDIITLRRIIRPNIPVVRSLELRERAFLHVDEDVYFGDLTDSLAKVWDMLEEQNEIVVSLNATLDSLTSHRINEVMKIFTLISVILLPMTLVASILGMNVPLPFQEEPWALPFSLVVMVILALGMYIYFRYRGWV
ncbi:MAG: magnesium/cobalt transporter CorA [Chloroflexaceae bacterium]